MITLAQAATIAEPSTWVELARTFGVPVTMAAAFIALIVWVLMPRAAAEADKAREAHLAAVKELAGAIREGSANCKAGHEAEGTHHRETVGKVLDDMKAQRDQFFAELARRNGGQAKGGATT